jgi:hypothetical protein
MIRQMAQSSRRVAYRAPMPRKADDWIVFFVSRAPTMRVAWTLRAVVFPVHQVFKQGGQTAAFELGKFARFAPRIIAYREVQFLLFALNLGLFGHIVFYGNQRPQFDFYTPVILKSQIFIASGALNAHFRRKGNRRM